MSISLSNSCTEKTREKVNKRHDLLLDKKLRDLEKIRQTVERGLKFEQKAVRAELKSHRKTDQRVLRFDAAGERRSSGSSEIGKDSTFSSYRHSEDPGKRGARRCSLPVNLLCATNLVSDESGSQRSDQGNEHIDRTDGYHRGPRNPSSRRQSLQPASLKCLQSNSLQTQTEERSLSEDHQFPAQLLSPPKTIVNASKVHAGPKR